MAVASFCSANNNGCLLSTDQLFFSIFDLRLFEPRVSEPTLIRSQLNLPHLTKYKQHGQGRLELRLRGTPRASLSDQHRACCQDGAPVHDWLQPQGMLSPKHAPTASRYICDSNRPIVKQPWGFPTLSK